MTVSEEIETRQNKKIKSWGMESTIRRMIILCEREGAN